MKEIASRQNPLVKRLRELHHARGRRAAGEFLLEGRNSVEAAIAAEWPLKLVLGTKEYEEVARRCEAAGVVSYLSTNEVLTAAAESQTPQGILAVATLPSPPREWDLEGLLLVIDGVGDPGNVGTLLRAADAAGIEKVIVTSDSADPWAPKVVRSAAGSLLHLPPLALEDRSPAAIIRELKLRNIPIYSAEAHAGVNCFTAHWPRRCSLVVGHETRGISPEFQVESTAVNIPVHGNAESLNAAMAGTLLMYAWRNCQG